MKGCALTDSNMNMFNMLHLINFDNSKPLIIVRFLYDDEFISIFGFLLRLERIPPLFNNICPLLHVLLLEVAIFYTS